MSLGVLVRGLRVKGIQLVQKLRYLRQKIRWWNKNVFGWVDLNIAAGVRVLNDIEVNWPEHDDALQGDQILLRKKAISYIWSNLGVKESMIWQKSRSRWIKEGDANSRFFMLL
ncbi:unnamed protein product [Lathyrus sativus]|nr:unnamed protein product [Lathyrus sativus]